MADDVVRPRLGRGLAALIGDIPDGDSRPGQGQRQVAVEFLRPNPRNPRRHFAEVELDELAASIKVRGVIQPILVRAVANLPGTFEIVAGERRWRAAQRAGSTEVPVIVVDIDDRASLEYAILENVQRADLNAIEEANGYERLRSEFNYTQRELAEILGKSRSHLANTLRLLQLPPMVQDRVGSGEISAGHARALLSVRDPEHVARQIVSEGLSVRDVETIAAIEAAAAKPDPVKHRRAVATRPPGVRAMEQELGRAFSLGVRVWTKPAGDGEIRIRYGTPEELQAFCRKFGLDSA